MKRLGIIGCGAIGEIVADYIVNNLCEQVALTAVCDVDEERVEYFKQKFSKNSFKIYNSYEDMIEQVDLVLESASSTISGAIAKKVLSAGKDVIVLSVGGIVDCYDEIKDIVAKEGTGVLYVPSGAIAGVDAINSASVTEIEKVELITRKPPKGLQGAPFLEENNISLDELGQEEFVVFDGSASDAIKGFPKNINVSALLSLSGLGADKTKVKIVTSEAFTTNSHEVYVKGSFGEMRSVTNNFSCPTNPKTSYLAALSACSLVSKVVSKIKFGS